MAGLLSPDQIEAMVQASSQRQLQQARLAAAAGRQVRDPVMAATMAPGQIVTPEGNIQLTDLLNSMQGKPAMPPPSEVEGSAANLMLRIAGDGKKAERYQRLLTPEEREAVGAFISNESSGNPAALARAIPKMRRVAEGIGGRPPKDIWKIGTRLRGAAREAAELPGVMMEGAGKAARGIGSALGKVNITNTLETAGKVGGAAWALGTSAGAITGLAGDVADALTSNQTQMQRGFAAESLLENQQWKAALADQRVQDVVENRVRLMQGEPTLVNALRGLPVMTQAEFIVGSMPNNDAVTKFALLDAMRDGTMQQALSQP